MVDHAVSLTRLASWTLSVIAAATLITGAYFDLVFVGFAAVLVGLAAAALTVRMWFVRMVGLVRLVGGLNAEPRESLRRVP